MLRRMLVGGIGLVGMLLAGGCRSNVNPSFSVSPDDAEQAIAAMRADPKPQARPLVIVGGFADPGIGPWRVAMDYTKPFESPRVITVTSTFGSDMLDCRRRMIEAVDKAYPTDDPNETVEVDVIGLSMGGLVARYAAAPAAGERRLRVARLFTISSPHAGAVLARVPTWDQKVLQMREGSAFLSELSKLDESATYELFCYTRLRDSTVGEHLAAPPGRIAWWVDTPPAHSAHVGAALDPRIEADILRRLRNEPAYATLPAAALPVR